MEPAMVNLSITAPKKLMFANTIYFYPTTLFLYLRNIFFCVKTLHHLSLILLFV